jgi:hypothetical protein
MSFETERLIHENAPMPDQLQALASVGMRSAVSRGRLKTANLKSRTRPLHYFIDEYNAYVDSPTDAAFLQVRHRMTASVGAKQGDGEERRRTLALFDVYFIEPETGGETAVRSVYKFEWTRRRTLLAQRTLSVLSEHSSNGIALDDYLDRFSIADDAASMLGVSEEMRTVTAEDCDDLTETMAEYMGVIESIHHRAEAA